ncbi:hypothetical protein QA601_00100 [Chitinispirillales bacterium ANBcel5]|uniref:hypothetical protein n=1 Tax=Cellulosispirillum alkaliphilum TaxID=3039283 RepID=UPI002A5950B0|nr:hypothetical protein [Chitinispirillales bacterium ANBcel5]
MSTQGAVLGSDGPQGREAWSPAAFYRDSLRLGISSYATLFYDAMDNLRDKHLTRLAVGGFLSWDRLVVKCAHSYFNALEIFFEHSFFLSAAYNLNRLHAGVDLRYFRSGITISNERVNSYQGGLSVVIFTRHVSLSLSSPSLIYTSDDTHHKASRVIKAGIHSSPNVFGSQGIIFEIEPQIDRPVRMTIAQEYSFSSQVSISFAVSGNPTQISLGITVTPGILTSAVSLVNHTELGWSKGVAVDYYR